MSKSLEKFTREGLPVLSLESLAEIEKQMEDSGKNFGELLCRWDSEIEEENPLIVSIIRNVPLKYSFLNLSVDLIASIARDLITGYILLKRQGERHRQNGFDWRGMPVVTEGVFEELAIKTREAFCYDKNTNFPEWCKQIDSENRLFLSYIAVRSRFYQQHQDLTRNFIFDSVVNYTLLREQALADE